ncbi:MAG: hypothetical protein ACKV19_12250 [Verrucomicrobiales bacterium]
MKPAVILLFGLVSLVAQAKDVGIFVDGGFGQGESDMNGLIDQRIDKAKEVFDKKYPPPNGESERADNRDSLESKLRGLNCGAGDNITIMLMGHGKKDQFVFSLEANRTKRILTPRQLCEWIGAAAKDPACCVRVVIFACHSGSFIDELSACPNVKAVYASCRSGEKSYSDAVFPQGGAMQDNGDWLKGFNEDWEAVLAGADPGDALDMATESAWEKMPIDQSDKQHPTGWRSGDLKVRAHVEQSFGPGSTSVRLHFWDPVFMRCQSREVRIDRTRITVDRTYRPCEWIEFMATFGAATADGVPIGPIPMSGPPTATEKPTARIMAHVESVSGDRRTIKIHTLEPNWLYCRKRTLKRPRNATAAPTVNACTWISEEVTVDDPDGAVNLTDGDLSPSDVTTPVVAHVEGTRRVGNMGQLCIKIQRPSFLADGKRRYVEIPLDDLRNYRECEHVRLVLHLNTLADDLQRAENIIKLDQRRFQQAEYDASLDGAPEFSLALPQGMTLSPAITVRNAGKHETEKLTILLSIRDIENQIVLDQTLQVEPLGLNETRAVEFSAWTPEQSGPYTATFAGVLPGDLNHDNDSLTVDFEVQPPQPGGTAPMGWEGAPIGAGPMPLIEPLEQSVRLVASGQGLGGNADQVSYAFQRISGDFAVSCVLFPNTLGAGQSAGLMVRLGLEPQASLAAVMIRQNMLQFVVRPQPNQPLMVVQSQPVQPAPLWVGLVRHGQQLLAQGSPDGWNWSPLGMHVLPQNSPPQLPVGLVGSSIPPQPIFFGDVVGFPFDGPPPPRVAEFAATPQSQNSIALSWSDESLTEMGFLLERADANGEFVPLVTLPQNTTSHLDAGLLAATEYTYRARALNFRPHVAWAPSVSAETHGPGLTAWSEALGVADPFMLRDGQLPAMIYAMGDSASITFGPNGAPTIRFSKVTGVHDLHIELQGSVDLLDWVTWRSVAAAAHGGTYEFMLPPDGDQSYYRFRFSEPP